MAELEIHHEVEVNDPFGKKIGVLASILAVLLGVVTIVSHRAHTDAVLFKSEANDKWSFYQAKRIKFHSLELGVDLLNAMPDRGPAANNPGALEVLGKLAGSDGYYWEMGAVIPPTTFSAGGPAHGQTDYTVRLFQVSDAA